MQRHGDEPIKAPATETDIIERIRQPLRHNMTQVDLTIVLKIVDDTPNDAATPISRDRCLEIEFTMSTIRARKPIGNRAGERLRACFAERRHDPRRLRIAIAAKILRRTDSSGADRADRRIKERDKRFNRFEHSECDHI